MTAGTRKRITDYCKSLVPVMYPATQSVYLYADDDLPVYGVGRTRREAQEELVGDIVVLWGEYVEAEPDTLAPSGERLRDNLMKRFGEEF